jgi:archaellum component FlaC
MNESATRKDIDEVIDIMKDFMGQVSNQFAQVNNRLDSLDQKYDHLINTIDGFLSRIDKYETELAARDNQFEKLLVWARKVSEKTGIPIENL